MYPYVYLPPREGIWPRLQTLAYLPAPLLLPPIQTHNFCSRPAGLSAAPREFHCFHGAGAALVSTPPWWALPSAGAAALGSSFPASSLPAPSKPASDAERGAPWPEGGSLQLQLRWGRVERAQGPPLPLPDTLRRRLRRAYGTYPRTDVRVTLRGGQWLLQAAPRVGEPEYQVTRRVVRRPTSGDGGDSGDSPAAREAVQRGRPKKKQGLR
ncbi:uncharacterized protein C10orf95 homolog [Meriones unguiculatus]|uniref:uncharacterized protein C10orf95 homolog n=1 Tax=Meriones unguiculatus TaxID=10047 RepID=UPI00108915C5|nr:uncharacterized protein C10orf95 homolog [Meriones unguiculatus]